MEWELVNIFTYNLAMCELLSIHGHITPSLAFQCNEWNTFVQESYFDNNYNNYIKWWDAEVVPLIEELNDSIVCIVWSLWLVCSRYVMAR